MAEPKPPEQIHLMAMSGSNSSNISSALPPGPLPPGPLPPGPSDVQIAMPPITLTWQKYQEILEARNPGERKPYHMKLYKTPKEISEALVTISMNKLSMSWDKTVILAFIAGVFASFGGIASIVAGFGGELPYGIAKYVMGATFQVALSLIVVFGAELFTGNTMILTVGLLKGVITWKQYVMHLVVVCLCNFLGAACGAVFFAYFGNVFIAGDNMAMIETIRAIAVAKCSMPPHAIFLRAIGCNWLVCLAVWFAVAAETIEGKLLSTFFCISTFVMAGFEHSIANMFFVPAGLLYGAQTTFWKFLYWNLILVTLGNYIAGALFMGVVAWYVYLRPSKAINDPSKRA